MGGVKQVPETIFYTCSKMKPRVARARACVVKILKYTGSEI
jgi:hypothetical protein